MMVKESDFRLGKVAVIGLGLIGGSLAGALRKSGRVSSVCGVDSDPEALRYALDNGVVDTATEDINRGVVSAEVVVLATSVGTIPALSRAVALAASVGTVITDVGSVKAPVVQQAESFLPPGVMFVGGHPIAGTERSGVWSSDPGLFAGKRVVLTPTSKTKSKAIEKVRGLWGLAGAVVMEMQAEEHDRVFALVSHLPHVVAYGLVNAVLEWDGTADPMGMAGGGLRDFTRIANSSPEMWADIVLMNAQNVLGSLRGFKGAIERIERLIEAGDAAGLTEEFGKSRDTLEDG